MKRWFSNRKHVLLVSLCVVVIGASALLVGFKRPDDDYFFKINKSIDIFGRVYREVALNYVDEVDPEKFMEAGIDGMLGTLDPYTNFISEQQADEVELITVGKYGGIGVTIGIRDGYITILSLMDGYSAQRQGLLPGDRILAINGQSLTGTQPNNVRSMTRGEPGSEIHLTVERDGTPKPMEFTVIREEIQLKNLSYANYVGDGIGYVHLERFSRGGGDELRLAIKELKLKGTIKGMILDLRDNPGGLLDEAVDVVEKFVPKGSAVVSTKGRTPDSERKYFAAEEPMLPDVPLVVLINRGSASASEIVAGAIQDLDRGVILGTRSFGKGLVQTITPLSYNAQLKITTAKYYTPSGRCIQEINYARKNINGVFETTPDSLKKQFKTLKGRFVYEAGGITPDTTVMPTDHSSVYNDLLRKSMYFKFATQYGSVHAAVPSSSDSLMNAFQQFLKDQHFVYEDEGETKLTELSAIAEKSKYSKTVRDEIDRLKNSIDEEEKNAVGPHSDEILTAAKIELMARWKGDTGRIEASLADDVQVKKAVALLQDGKEYQKLLRAK